MPTGVLNAVCKMAVANVPDRYVEHVQNQRQHINNVFKEIYKYTECFTTLGHNCRR